MRISFLFLLLAIPALAQDDLKVSLGKDKAFYGKYDDVKTFGKQIVPKSGTFTVAFYDADHSSGYLSRPGCIAWEIGEKQHLFTIENDDKQITVKAPKGVLIKWECHGYMANPHPVTPPKPISVGAIQ